MLRLHIQIFWDYILDTFCQEHLTYFSFISFNNLIKQTNLKVIDYSRNGINGGSINFDLVFKDSKFKVKNKIKVKRDRKQIRY